MTLWSHLYSSWVHSSVHDMSMYLFVYVLDLFLLKLEYTSLLRIGSFVMCSAEVTFWYYCLLVNSSVLFHLSPAACIFFHRSRLISCIADCDLFVLTRNSLVWFLLLSCTFLLSASSDIVYVPTVTASSFPHANHWFFYTRFIQVCFAQCIITHAKCIFIFIYEHFFYELSLTFFAFLSHAMCMHAFSLMQVGFSATSVVPSSGCTSVSSAPLL